MMKLTVLALSIAGIIGLPTSLLASPTYNDFANFYAKKSVFLPKVAYKQLPHYAFLFRSSSPQHVSKLPKRISPPGERVFVFSPRHKYWAAYNSDGFRVARGVANGGAHYCPDVGRACRTPRGSFRVHSKGPSSCVSSKYPLPSGGAPMPYCMKFKGGYAIHGSPHISNRNGSHGCIRVKTAAAAWLSNNFIRHGTKVVVLPY
jgi:hypothetical protein